jgi:hypothetical protein
MSSPTFAEHVDKQLSEADRARRDQRTTEVLKRWLDEIIERLEQQLREQLEQQVQEQR